MHRILLLLIFSSLFSYSQKQSVSTIQVPGFNRYCTLDYKGESIIPNGRIVRPAGEVIRIAPDPFGMTLSEDGSLALSVHNDLLTIINTKNLIDRKVASPFQQKGSYMGAVISKDNKIAWLSGGNNGDIIVFDLNNLEIIKRISINGLYNKVLYKESFTGDIRLSKDGKTLFILDQFNFRMVTLNLETCTLTGSIPTGRFPFGIDISPDEKYAYVANTGIYDYPLAPGLDKDNLEKVGLDFPPYGIPSGEAEKGININGQKIPGLPWDGTKKRDPLIIKESPPS